MKRFIPFLKSEPTVNVVRLQGAITNGGRGLDDVSLAPVMCQSLRSSKMWQRRAAIGWPVPRMKFTSMAVP